ncbi:hypothetical protein KM1_164390 [Entamoeba histolytica HM-3:IMSS]|uniref:Uncharacterized protein n=1 Tax=Entamoeba histolytica HM-3:IMSS TaxID=885315 RepID=M7WD08_ENTHI|nr:hypothetical protein KM1_164390 [Entamoeba histolytica HM-3:IMSS]
MSSSTESLSNTSVSNENGSFQYTPHKSIFRHFSVPNFIEYPFSVNDDMEIDDEIKSMATKKKQIIEKEENE